MFGQSTILSEDFNGGVINNTWFPTFPGNNMIVAGQEASAPSGDGWVGKLENNNEGGLGAVVTGPVDLADFYYEANIFIPVDQATYYGLEFRVDTTGSSSGYNFVARFKPGGFLTPRIRFRYRVGSSPNTIHEWIDNVPNGIPSTAGWHNMAVAAKADSFWLYYDGQLLPNCPIIDQSASSGFVGLYYWDMTVIDSVMMIDDLVVTDQSGPNSIDQAGPVIPNSLQLDQNYPNPFNPNTTIRFSLLKAEQAKLVIYNMAGEVVKTLANGPMATGNHEVKWDATDNSGNRVSAGVYLYRLQAGNQVASRKMILLK